MTLDNALDDLYTADYTADRLTQAACAVAELIRYLNHATLGTNVEATLPYPSSVATVLIELDQAVQRLPQTLHQLNARMSQIADDTDAVDAALTDAARHAGGLRYLIAAAAAFANQIPARDPIAG